MARPFLRLLLLIAALGGLIVLVPRTASHAEPAPAISLSPDTGPGGTSVSVSGAFVGCSVSVVYEVLWDSQVVTQGDSVPTSGGYGFFAHFNVPAGTSMGVHQVRVPVKTAPCWQTLVAPFTVTSGQTPTPTPTPSPTSTAIPTPLLRAEPPHVSWVAPDDGATLLGPIQFAVRPALARPGGPTVSAVRFVAGPPDAAGDVACMAPSPDGDGIFSCTWDPANAGVAGGPIQVSFDVADQVGQIIRNAGGIRVVSYQPPAPTDVPIPTSTPTRGPAPLPPDIPIWTLLGDIR
jgi:hypothetical protein